MTRRATIRTAHADPETVAAALAPDNTDEMETHVESVADNGSTSGPAETGDPTTAGDRVVVTRIERESTSGLQSTVDDTLVNLAVAEAVATGARGGTDSDRSNAAEPSPTTDESTADQPTTDTNDTP